MADERWQKLREIFDSALHHKREERRNFVKKACGEDKALYAEVESLLASLDSADNFLEVPAVAKVLDGFAGNRLEKGQSLGHYEIIKQLGTGGMGEVYLARDQKLGRQVAVKILNEKFSNDASNLHRFIREAKAASALNHPNILVIHEVGEAEGSHFIVSEYVEGETLRTICREKRLEIGEVLDLSLQIAGALATAHKAHLIHRDIKPENIMVRPDGYVKILDFGLAKLVEQKNRSFLGLEELTANQNETAKGAIMGTVNYMSPEQAKGEDVDERTDIFSFGVVIYEMIAGKTPFAGESMAVTFANLINAQPPPLAQFSPNVPEELQRIVSKALRKNRGDRYQTMKGLLTDLSVVRPHTGENQVTEEIDPFSSGPEGVYEGGRSTREHSSEWPAPSPLRWIAPLALVMLLAAAFIGPKLWQTMPPDRPTLEQKRLTVGGGTTRAAISADGRHAAVAQNAALILSDLEKGGERILVPAVKDIRILTIAFRPDGTGIYFGKRQIESTFVSLYSVPLSGGEPTKILEDIYGSLSFSPDSKKFAFVRRYPELNEYALLTADADGSNITKLASSQMPNRFEGAPAWSPDGSKIVLPAINVDGGFHFTLARVDAVTGSFELVPEQRWTAVSSVVWLADSRRIVLSGQDEISIVPQLWQVDADTGATSRVTDDSFVYESINGTADGRAFVSVKVRQSSHVWILGDPPIQLTSGFDNYDGVGGLVWAPDGSIFYHSRASRRDAIWRMRQDGSEAKELTPDTGGGFAVSPDGRLLVFQAKQSADHLGLQLMDLTDGSERSLTKDVTALTPSFSADGKSVAFSLYDKKLSLHEIPVNGGQPKVISDEYRLATAPSVSPSGKFIAFAFTRTQTGNIQAGIAVLAKDSKQLVTSHPAKITIGSNYEDPTIQWSADESELYFIQLDVAASVSNIMKIRITDGAISNLTNFADGRIFNFAVEPGGRRMLVARGIIERDASLIKVDRPL